MMGWLFERWREKYLAAPDRALTVVHIPARLGSSRIPRKNIKELCGLPLIAYTILLARSLPEVDRIFINTESPEIAEVAAAYGAETPFFRPASLAETDAPMNLAVRYFYERLRDSPLPVKKVLTLLPTNLFRNRERISAMVRALDNHLFVYSGLRFDLPWRRLVREDDGALEPVFQPDSEPGVSWETLKYTGLFMGHGCMVPWKNKPFFKVYLPGSPLEAVDLDTPEDWELAEDIVSHNRFDFGFDRHAMLH